jgi:hypothetical protein
MPLRVVLLGRLVFLVLMDFGVVALGDRLKSGLPNHGDNLSQATVCCLICRHDYSENGQVLPLRLILASVSNTNPNPDHTV